MFFLTSPPLSPSPPALSKREGVRERGGGGSVF